MFADFYDYWNTLVENWMNQREDCRPQNNIVDDPRHYIPEPFYGNPKKCSVVLLNINPGCGCDLQKLEKFVCGKFKDNSTCWSDYAEKFYYLTNADLCLTPTVTDVHGNKKNGGADWWVKRKEWLDRIVDYCAKIQGVQKGEELPFAMEYCPWHSKAISDIKGELKEKLLLKNPDLARYVFTPASNAAKHSTSKLIIGIISQSKIDEALKAMGYQARRLWNKDNPPEGTSWPLINGKINTRRYSLYVHDEFSPILLTWAQGGNLPPSNLFSDVEHAIIDEIYNIMGYSFFISK